jgi:hypothetical protein
LKYALDSTGYDVLLSHAHLSRALAILQQSPAYKKASSEAGAAGLLSLSQPTLPSLQPTPQTVAFHVAGGPINLFSHGASRLTTANLNKSCDEIIHQWHNKSAQVRKCWGSFTYDLVEGNTDTFQQHCRKFSDSASRDLSLRRETPQREFPETARVVSELIKIVNLTLVGTLEVADVHVFAQTSENCVFLNHLDLHVPTRFALNVILGVRDAATGAVVSEPLTCGGMIIDSRMWQGPRYAETYTIANGLEFPLRKAGDAALFRGSTHVHRTLSPPEGSVVYKLVIFLN